MIAIFFLFSLCLFSFTSASSDFTSYSFGLGTTNKRSFSFSSKNSKSSEPWKVFSRTGSKASLSSDLAVCTIQPSSKDNTNSIITSNFGLQYGQVDWVAKVAAGPVLTSFKLSAAHSGTGLLVSGYKPNQIMGSYNGTHYDKDIIQVLGTTNLSEAFHKYSIIWTNEKITWLVDDQIYKILLKDTLTNQVDIANWPTTPNTVNFMIESISSDDDSNKYKSELKSVSVQDYTGGKYYEAGNSGSDVKFVKDGDKLKLSTGKTVSYPKELQKWVDGSIKKRDTISSFTKLLNSSIVSNVTGNTSSLSTSYANGANFSRKGSSAGMTLTFIALVMSGLLA